MKVLIEHTFAIPPSEFAPLYFEEPFSIAVTSAAKIGRTLLRLDREGSRIVRHVRCEPERDIPPAIAKLIDGRFHYVEELDFDLEGRRGQWRVIPSVVPDKVKASGTLEFLDAAGPNGEKHTKRIVRGDVIISVFGVGSLVERFVVGEVEKSYDAASAFTDSYLASRAT
jgi:hypothetical protein